MSNESLTAIRNGEATRSNHKGKQNRTISPTSILPYKNHNR